MNKFFLLIAFLFSGICACAQPLYDWHNVIGGTISGRYSSIRQTASGDSSQVYVAGHIDGAVDLDPGPGVARPSDTTHRTGYILVYDSDGNYMRALFFNPVAASSYSELSDLFIAGNGDILVTGGFVGTVDFNPLVGTSLYTSPANGSGFVARYTKYGQLLWIDVFGASSGNYVSVQCVSESAGKITIGGGFYIYTGAIDLDPGPGVATYTASDEHGGFIVRLSSAGLYTWSKGFIGDQVIAINTNASGNIACAGQAVGQTDFDPGPGIASYTSVVQDPFGDFFVAGYSTNGIYTWHHASGNVLNESFGHDVHIASNNETVVAGACGGLIDLDPGVGVTFANSSGSFCAKYSAVGALIWGHDGGNAFRLDASGNVYVADPYGTHCLSPAGVAFWSTPVVDSLYTTTLALSANGKLRIGWNLNKNEDVDPGAGSTMVNYIPLGARSVVLSLDVPAVSVEEENTTSSNPSVDYIVVTGNNPATKSFVIRNALGAEVLRANSTGTETRIDVSSLAPGIYFLQCESDNSVQQFVISRN